MTRVHSPHRDFESDSTAVEAAIAQLVRLLAEQTARETATGVFFDQETINDNPQSVKKD